MERLSLPPISKKRLVTATLIVVGIAVAFWLLYRFRNVVLILFIAVFLSTALTPAVERMEKRGIPRPTGIVLVFLTIVLLLAIFVAVGAPLIADQSTRLVRAIPDAYRAMRFTMLESSNLLISRLALELPRQPALIASAPAADEGDALQGMRQVLDYAALSMRVVLGLIATLLLAFYWTVGGEQIKRSLLLALAPSRRESARELVDDIEGRLGSYISGVAILVVLVGVMNFVAYLLIDIPYAFVLAIVAGLLEAVPVIGPTLGVVPAAIVGYSVDPIKALWVVLAGALIQLIENNLLVPRVMNRAIGVHPLVILLAFIAFGAVLGPLGAIVAIPLSVVVQILFEHYLLDPDAVLEEEPEGRDKLSVLRLQTQELVGDVRKRARDRADAMEGDDVMVEDRIEAIASELHQILQEYRGENEELSSR